MHKIIIGFFIGLLAVTASTALAEDGAAGVNFSGFVDASYYGNGLDDTSSFNLDQAELDIEKTIEGSGGLRIDIQHVNGDELTADDVLEQGYMWVDMGAVKFTFGKFNAPIGWELLDPNDMYQFSHAMVFDYGLPTNLTGAMLSGEFGMIDFAAYIVNGWDLISDNNEEKTIGARVGIMPQEGVNIGVSYISGDETEVSDTAVETTNALSVIDVDFTFTMVENLTIGAEFNSGTYEGMSAIDSGDAEWTGYLVMANYAITDKVALTVRYDAFDDTDGARLGSGIKESRQAFTISPSYTIGDGFGMLAEYRVTTSDENVFEDADGNAEDSVSEVAVEFTYSF